MRHQVLRALLSYPSRKWHQNELAQDADVDPGSHVNRVVIFLLQEHYADYDGRGPGEVIFVTRPGELLDTWRGCWEHMRNALRRASAGFYSPAMDTTMSGYLRPCGARVPGAVVYGHAGRRRTLPGTSREPAQGGSALLGPALRGGPENRLRGTGDGTQQLCPYG